MCLHTIRDETPSNVDCRLDNVVTLQKDDDSIEPVIWQLRTTCCGSRGIFPEWTREPSTCSGPDQCILLQAGELFYPPDIATWMPVRNTDGWEEMKSRFVFPETCGCELSESMVKHIEEMQQRWGIIKDA